jgi:hypothetical protein
MTHSLERTITIVDEHGDQCAILITAEFNSLILTMHSQDGTVSAELNLAELRTLIDTLDDGQLFVMGG